MHGSSPFLRSGWPVGVEPTRDMSHSHARRSDSRHGHSWSTWGYSKTHSADYRSAALPLELQVQSCWSRQQGFNPHPSPYRGDTLALSYAGPNSVVQILPPLLLVDSRLAHESARGVNRHAARLTEQLHACFRRSPICLAPVAVATRGYQVLPRAQSASSARNYMLQFQFAAQELLAAILANVSVANEDVLPRKRLNPSGKRRYWRRRMTQGNCRPTCTYRSCVSSVTATPLMSSTRARRARVMFTGS